MFIKEDTFVRVTSGDWAGSCGRVDKIAVDSSTHSALIFVSLFSREDGRFYAIPFASWQLEPRKSNYEQLAAALLIESGGVSPERLDA